LETTMRESLTTPPTAVRRRSFLRFSAAAGIAAPLGLASCAASGSGPSDDAGDAAASPEASADNPFGVAEGSTVEAVIFDGGYGIDYATFAAAIFGDVQQGSTVEVTGSTQIAQQMQPRFVGGNPPDLLDNNGANAIGLSAIVDGLEDLSDVVQAPNLEGTVIADTLYPGVLDVGMYDGKLAALNYVLTVYALWYSQTLFDANGWTPPKTWDEALELGAAAQEQGMYLFTWGTEAASYYLTLAVDSAIKEGGDEVRLAMDNLQADAWSLPADRINREVARPDRRRRLVPFAATTFVGVVATLVYSHFEGPGRAEVRSVASAGATHVGVDR